VLTVSTEGDLEAAFTTMFRRQAGAVIVMPDPLFFSRREQLVALAARYAVPTIYFVRQTEIGGLMSYGTSLSLDGAKRVGTYTGKILRGAKPSDLPVQQSIRTELVINLKTAKALGLTIPPTLLARADDVIEYAGWRLTPPTPRSAKTRAATASASSTTPRFREARLDEYGKRYVIGARERPCHRPRTAAGVPCLQPRPEVGAVYAAVGGPK
jgi:hypothetical protein